MVKCVSTTNRNKIKSLILKQKVDYTVDVGLHKHNHAEKNDPALHYQSYEYIPLDLLSRSIPLLGHQSNQYLNHIDHDHIVVHAYS